MEQTPDTTEKQPIDVKELLNLLASGNENDVDLLFHRFKFYFLRHTIRVYREKYYDSETMKALKAHLSTKTFSNREELINELNSCSSQYPIISELKDQIFPINIPKSILEVVDDMNLTTVEALEILMCTNQHLGSHKETIQAQAWKMAIVECLCTDLKIPNEMTADITNEDIEQKAQESYVVAKLEKMFA